jgi:hypothetical protein
MTKRRHEHRSSPPDSVLGVSEALMAAVRRLCIGWAGRVTVVT